MIRGLSLEWPHRGERRAATNFRQYLQDHGYEMSQFSVYMGFCVGKEQAERRIREVSEAIPDKGRVHILSVTDRQFEQMSVFRGKSRSHGRSVPNQLELF